MRISDILRAKGTVVETIAPSATLFEATEKLTNAKIGALVVSTDETTINGILSERDVMQSIAPKKSLDEVLVKDLMTEEVITCTPQNSVKELMQIMTTSRIRHLPVMENNVLSGIVSIGDLVKVRLEELEREKDHLHGYIAGR